MNRKIAIPAVLALMLLTAGASAAEAAPARAGFAQIASFALDDFSWVRRELVKTPAFRSAKVRYTIWALGEGRRSSMVMAWDESGGTGTGYDTFYFDTNLNGDLTEAGKCFTAGLKDGQGFEVKNIKEADGPRTYSIKYVREKDNFDWQSGFHMSGPGTGYDVGLLPGNLKIRWSEDLKTAPVYRIGGPAIVLAADKLPGQSLGKWSAGDIAQVPTAVSLFGNELSCQLRFYHSKPPGGEPQILLRVAKDGQVLEEIAFAGGGG
jgi:hypothetical protein